jgi:ribosome maturation factor RimP
VGPLPTFLLYAGAVKKPSPRAFFITANLNIMSGANQTYRDKIVELIEPVIESEGMELVDLECLRMKTRWLVRIYIDKEQGVTVDDCSEISNQVGDILAVHEIPPGPYTLEVSSPGLDRPLTKDGDFIRFKGNTVKIRVKNPIDRIRNFQGILMDFVSEAEGKYLILNREGHFYRIAKENIAKANLQYEF